MKIGSGCLVWVGSVQKMCKAWNFTQDQSHSPRGLATQKSGPFGSTMVAIRRLVARRHQAFLRSWLLTLHLDDSFRVRVVKSRVGTVFRVPLRFHVGKLLGLG